MTFSNMIAKATGGKFYYTSQKKQIDVFSLFKQTAQKVDHGWQKCTGGCVSPGKRGGNASEAGQGDRDRLNQQVRHKGRGRI